MASRERLQVLKMVEEICSGEFNHEFLTGIKRGLAHEVILAWSELSEITELYFLVEEDGLSLDDKVTFLNDIFREVFTLLERLNAQHSEFQLLGQRFPVVGLEIEPDTIVAMTTRGLAFVDKHTFRKHVHQQTQQDTTIKDASYISYKKLSHALLISHQDQGILTDIAIALSIYGKILSNIN
ncbi:MAG TPA: hypothetical protein VD999_01050 [Vitreimonas sp.]|nr:hypothetical protein [Vitreimonas sp.]